MTKTVILLNPMGTDVTNFVNGTTGVPQLLKGTIMDAGDTLYTLPYNNTSGAVHITDAIPMLDAKLKSTTGEVLVFGYSEGCQIADWWLANQGSTPAAGVDPAEVSFLLIANADRKYGGFVYQSTVFDAVAYTAGKPDNTPYTVIDFARQYDGVADFPTAAPIQTALNNLQALTTDTNAFQTAMQDIANVVANTSYANAALNAVTGFVAIHNNYLQVTVADTDNVSLVDGNITWMWSPTYPVPLLGIGGTFPAADQALRPQIETAYSRPVTLPTPDYSANTGWGIEPFTVTGVPGWWAELNGTAAATITPTAMASGTLPRHASATVTPTAAAAGQAVGTAAVTVTLTPSTAGHAVGTAAITVTPSAGASGAGVGTAAVTVTPTPSVAGQAVGTAAVTVTPSPSASIIPTYDNSVKSAKQSALASGSPFTWSHTGSAGAYGIVFVACQSGVMTLAATTASVTWGGTTMTSLGNLYNHSTSTQGWGWVFVLNGIPAGAQTISVTLTQSGQTFTGYGSSYSYTNIASVGTLQTASGVTPTNPTLSVTAANTTDIVWGATSTNNVALSGFSLTARQNNNTPSPVFWGGDTTGSTSVTVSGTSAAQWSVFGLDLK